jgi:hypothetical protein
MRNDPTNPDVTPEQLAAYLDGELGGAERSRVEAWLTTCPDATGEIDGQRRVARLWADNPPPDPSQAAWSATLARVRARLPVARPRGLRRSLWFGAAAAAALVAALLGTHLFQGGAAPKVEKVEPFPVVGPGDVTIISMDGRDAGRLVVAAPPVAQPILAVGQDDVSVMSMEPDPRDDGRVPLIGEGDVPMIVAPLARAGGR